MITNCHYFCFLLFLHLLATLKFHGYFIPIDALSYPAGLLQYIRIMMQLSAIQGQVWMRKEDLLLKLLLETINTES